MMGMYRIVRDGKPVFYELMTFVEEKGSLVFRLKHFNADLTGWEEKEITVDFPFVAKGGGMMHFEGVSLHREGDRALTIYLAMRQNDGSVHEEVFRYTRVSPGGQSTGSHAQIRTPGSGIGASRRDLSRRPKHHPVASSPAIATGRRAPLPVHRGRTGSVLGEVRCREEGGGRVRLLQR